MIQPCSVGTYISIFFRPYSYNAGMSQETPKQEAKFAEI